MQWLRAAAQRCMRLVLFAADGVAQPGWADSVCRRVVIFFSKLCCRLLFDFVDRACPVDVLDEGCSSCHSVCGTWVTTTCIVRQLKVGPADTGRLLLHM